MSGSCFFLPSLSLFPFFSFSIPRYLCSLLFYYCASFSWTESQLREYLLEQGAITPKSTTEQLRILAKQKLAQASTAVC